MEHTNKGAQPDRWRSVNSFTGPVHPVYRPPVYPVYYRGASPHKPVYKGTLIIRFLNKEISINIFRVVEDPNFFRRIRDPLSEKTEIGSGFDLHLI